MSIYSIAGINIKIDDSLRFMRSLREDYKSIDEKYDFILSIPEIYSGDLATEEIAEKSNWIQRSIADNLSEYDAVLLHSACFDVDGIGVAFAARSGTGKSTHMNLWQRLLGERMTVVNGDKPIVRFFEDEPEQPYAYGTPWNGKEGYGCNMRTKLNHICFIERSTTNYVEKMDKKAVADRLMKQVYIPKDPTALMNTMTLVDRLLSCCNFWIIHCNMEPEAAEVAYKTIFNI